MINLYPQNETEYSSNGTILTDCLSCLVTEESNGIFNAELHFPLSNVILDEQMILNIPTHRGMQKFRILKIKKSHFKNTKTKYVYARHIFYDLSDNYLRDVRLVDRTADQGIKHIFSNTQYAHPFTGSAEDIQGTGSATYIRRNPVDALMGSSGNSMLNLYGGDIERDNFTVKIKGGNRDKGFVVALGKNMAGIEEDLDYSSVITRLQPTAVRENNTVIELPEVYIDSPLIANYSHPKIQEHRVQLSDTEKTMTDEEIFTILRSKANAKYTDDHVDAPLVNFKVDFVQVEKSVQFEGIKVLTDMALNDTLTVDCTSLNVNLKCKLIKVVYNSLREKYEQLELGDFRRSLTNQKKDTLNEINKRIGQVVDLQISAMLKAGLDKIVGNTGGYMKTLFNAEGLPQGTLYMDSPDESTTKNYILINNQGIAFGNAGLSNPPTVAISIDGTVASDSAFFRSLTTNLIQSEFGQSLDLSSNTSINLKVQSEVSAQLNDPDTQAQFKGDPGEPGTPAVQYTIGTDNYWYADGVKTDKLAKGADADTWTIGADGYWYKNGVKTSNKSQGDMPVVYSTSAPSRNDTLWYDTANNLLKVWNGSKWVNNDSALESRISTAETNINQNRDSIALKADQATVSQLTNRVSNAESKITPEAITDTVRSSTAYLGDLNTKESYIYKNNTAPEHADGRLWLDTSVNPNVLKRSYRGVWYKITPTQANEVGAYSQIDGLALLGRVSSAETSISQNSDNIALKVSQADYDAKMGVFTGTVSEIKQTAESVKLSFDSQIIGGTNLFPNSRYLNKALWKKYDAQKLIITGEKIDFNTAKGSSPILGYFTMVEIIPKMTQGSIYTVSFIANNLRTDRKIGFSIGGHDSGGYQMLNPGEKKRLVFTGKLTSTTVFQIQVIGESLGYAAQFTLDRLKVEKGTNATDWSPNPDELYSGITSVDKDGIKVGRSDTDINSRMMYNGFSVVDGTETIMSAGEAGVQAPEVSANSFIGNIINTLTVPDNGNILTLTVGSGKTFPTITSALQSLKRQKYLNWAYVKIEVYGTIADNVYIYGFEGAGIIEISFTTGAILIGSIFIFRNGTHIRVKGTSSTTKGTIKRSNSTYTVKTENTLFSEVYNMNVDADGGSKGIEALNGGILLAYDNDFVRCDHAIYAWYGAVVSAYNNIGNTNAQAMYSVYGSILGLAGTVPVGTASYERYLGNAIVNGTLTPTQSSYSPPPVTAKTFTNTFKPVKIYTVDDGDNSITSYYGSTGAQSYWAPDMNRPERAMVVFDKGVYESWQGGTNVNIEVRVRRSSRAHGNSTGVAPKPKNFTPSTGFGTCTRGAWSSWATVPTGTFINGQSILQFTSNAGNADYMIIDDAEVRVTYTKNV